MKTKLNRSKRSESERLIRLAETAGVAGRWSESAELAEHALTIDPESVSAKILRMQALSARPRDVADLMSVLRLAREVMAARPGSWEAHLFASVAYFHLGEDDAYAHHRDAALSTMPLDGIGYLTIRLTDAIWRLRRDLAAFKTFEYLKWAFPVRRGAWRPEAETWDGSLLAGRRILIHAIHDGFGDCWQFIRYAPMVAALGGSVRLLCYPSQERLIARCARSLGIDRIFVWGGTYPADEFSCDLEARVMSLPAIFGTTLETIPVGVPYLRADEQMIDRWRPVVEAIPGRLKIGVAWRGNPAHPGDGLRSFSLGELAPLAAVPGVSLVSLQKGPGADEIADAGFQVADLGPEFAAGDWLDTAAVVSGLDLVIACDSAIAHLAGALGKSVWLALSRPAEWRWLRDRSDSPWYPTMRLFRQERLGEWGPVFRRMAEALATL